MISKINKYFFLFVLIFLNMQFLNIFTDQSKLEKIILVSKKIYTSTKNNRLKVFFIKKFNNFKLSFYKMISNYRFVKRCLFKKKNNERTNKKFIKDVYSENFLNGRIVIAENQKDKNSKEIEEMKKLINLQNQFISKMIRLVTKILKNISCPEEFIGTIIKMKKEDNSMENTNIEKLFNRYKINNKKNNRKIDFDKTIKNISNNDINQKENGILFLDELLFKKIDKLHFLKENLISIQMFLSENENKIKNNEYLEYISFKNYFNNFLENFLEKINFSKNIFDLLANTFISQLQKIIKLNNNYKKKTFMLKNKIFFFDFKEISEEVTNPFEYFSRNQEYLKINLFLDTLNSNEKTSDAFLKLLAIKAKAEKIVFFKDLELYKNNADSNIFSIY